MPTALALSPHLDDAAFSCGGTLATLAAAGWRVVMATVFTATVPEPRGFALACQLDKNLGPEVDYMALRRAEDAAAAGSLGIAAPRHLPFREAPHRGYDSAPELFADLRADDAIGPDLAGALGALIAEIRPDLLLAPQAIGGHVDHLQVVAALDALSPACPVLFWRDFPYTVRGSDPKEPLRARFAGLADVACGLDATAAARKAQACADYATQLGFQFGGVESLRRRLAQEGGVERFRASAALPPAWAGLLRDVRGA